MRPQSVSKAEQGSVPVEWAQERGNARGTLRIYQDCEAIVGPAGQWHKRFAGGKSTKSGIATLSWVPLVTRAPRASA